MRGVSRRASRLCLPLEKTTWSRCSPELRSAIQLRPSRCAAPRRNTTWCGISTPFRGSSWPTNCWRAPEFVRGLALVELEVEEVIAVDEEAGDMLLGIPRKPHRGG